MKKAEKYIYLVLGLILIVVIACGIIYVIVTNNNETETNEEPNNNENKEQITLSKSELEKYLSYVPIDTESYLNRNVYNQASVNLETINKTLLRDMGIIRISSCFDNDNCSFDTNNEIPINIDLFPTYEIQVSTKNIPLIYLNELLQQMYNYELTDLKNALSIEDVFDAGGMSYIYQDGYFLLLAGGPSGGEHISVLDNYEANEEELVIYEYTAYYDSSENKLIDYYTESETDLDGWCGNTTDEEKIIVLHDYLEEYKKEFTLYKHTFKKNDTGYYWYSTEIA